jgi:hypothetical protein
MRLVQASMTPQDIAVLLLIASASEAQWSQVKLAEELNLSQPEISNSLARSRYVVFWMIQAKVLESKHFLNSFNTESHMHFR